MSVAKPKKSSSSDSSSSGTSSSSSLSSDSSFLSLDSANNFNYNSINDGKPILPYFLPLSGNHDWGDYFDIPLLVRDQWRQMITTDIESSRLGFYSALRLPSLEFDKEDLGLGLIGRSSEGCLNPCCLCNSA